MPAAFSAMSDVSNSFFSSHKTHGIIQPFINVLLEQLHLTPEIELSEYSSSKKLLDSILESSTRGSPSLGGLLWYMTDAAIILTVLGALGSYDWTYIMDTTNLHDKYSQVYRLSLVP